jgi:hypothetical protein
VTQWSSDCLLAENSTSLIQIVAANPASSGGYGLFVQQRQREYLTCLSNVHTPGKIPRLWVPGGPPLFRVKQKHGTGDGVHAPRAPTAWPRRWHQDQSGRSTPPHPPIGHRWVLYVADSPPNSNSSVSECASASQW